MTLESATDIRTAIVSGQVSAREITERALSRIASLDETLHACLTVDREQALAAADDIDRRTSAGEQPGPLWGVPFTVKDLYDTAGMRTTYGSQVFASHIPSTDAVFVSRIRDAGGVLVAKTNTPEFGIYIRTVNDLQPETVNPWDYSRTTGGSSGGAAASVAAGYTPIAVGSDGGGSVRIPAALCGLVGLKPTFGSIPRGGGSPVGTRRFSSPGPLARTATDALLLWETMRGPHPDDPLSQTAMITRYPEAPSSPDPPGRLRLGWVGDSGVPGAEADVVASAHAAATQLADLLDTELHVRASDLDAPALSEDFYAVMQADRVSTGGAALMADPVRAAMLTDYSRHQFENGSSISGADYSRAIETRLRARRHMAMLLDGVDVLLTPTLAFVAPRIPEDRSALPEDARRGFVAFTFLANYTGLPAATVPCGLVRGLPVGLQLVGRPGSEPLLLRVCQQFQDGVFDAPVPPRSAISSV